MPSEVKLSRIYPVLEELEYPLSRAAAIEAGEDVTLLLADGTVNLGRVIEESPVQEFARRDDLLVEVMSRLPRKAVGEPYQSEGDA